jgi:signal peptide peptidase SppA
MRRFIPFLPKPVYVPVIRLAGTIGTGARSLERRGAGPADRPRLQGQAVLRLQLVINSPGGSAVQSSLIAARIRRLADEKKVPVHAFVEDVAASGGYWLACAADDIWVDDSSIVGSIGVIFASFGFPELLARQGVERRVVTAGKSKSFADPFLPQKTEDIDRLKALQTPIHQAFIDHVKHARGTRLSETADLFNADVWVGQQAVGWPCRWRRAYGPKLKALYGDKVRLVPLGQRRSLLQRLGMAATDGLMQGIEERALWARFGL